MRECILFIVVKLKEAYTSIGWQDNLLSTRLGGIMLRASALHLGGWWFEPWLSHIKEFKNGMCCFLA